MLNITSYRGNAMMRNLYTSIRRDNIKILIIPDTGKDVEEADLSYTAWWDCKMEQTV